MKKSLLRPGQTSFNSNSTQPRQYPHQTPSARDEEKPKQPYCTRPPRAVQELNAAWLKKVKAMRISHVTLRYRAKKDLKAE